MDQPTFFTLAHPAFFETISRYEIAPEYTNRLRSLVPETWTVARFDVWVAAQPEVTGAPRQGFKIHVSATSDCATRVLELVAPECVRHNTGFKIAGDRRLLDHLNSKQYNRGGSGKFMTIYPRSDEVFRELIEAIYEITSVTDMVGPYILSDRRYKDSKVVYYRYGGFSRIDRLRTDGSKEPVIAAPSGELVRDERRPYYRLPDWVTDPFGGSQSLNYEGPLVLKERYLPEAVASFSNAGGVYFGTDNVTGKRVVIKEARPHANHWSSDSHSSDAVTFLHRDYRILRRLEHLGCVPEAIDLFTEWEHTFLVESRLEGVSYQNFWANEENILGPFIRWPGKIASFVPVFRKVAASLLDTVSRVHACGVILGDVSPGNVFLDPDTLESRLIDFESAILTDEMVDNSSVALFTSRWGTPGFWNPRRRDGTVLSEVDDYYGVGMLLYSAVVPMNPFFGIHPAARDRFLDEFVALGVPAEAASIIRNLLEGRPDLAHATLASWSNGT